MSSSCPGVSFIKETTLSCTPTGERPVIPSCIPYAYGKSLEAISYIQLTTLPTDLLIAGGDVYRPSPVRKPAQAEIEACHNRFPSTQQLLHNFTPPFDIAGPISV